MLKDAIACTPVGSVAGYAMRAEPSWTIGAGPPRIIGSKDPSDAELDVVASAVSVVPIDVTELLSGRALSRPKTHNIGRAKKVTSAMSRMRRRSNVERNNLFSPCSVCFLRVATAEIGGM